VEDAPKGHRWARIRLLPRTRLGFWAVGLLAAFAAFFILLISLAASGQEGGEEFSDNLWLALPGLAAGLSAVLGGVTAAVAVVRRGERSVLVFLPLIVGIFVAIFLLGELVGHE
jgi:flagellar biosynthesis protein FliQ